MIWPIMFMIMGLFCGRKWIRKIIEEGSTERTPVMFDRPTKIMASFLFSIAAAVVGLIVAFAIGLALPKVWVHKETIKLMHIASSDEADNEYFVSLHHTRLIKTYHFLQTKGGKQEFRIIPANNNVTVFEQEKLPEAQVEVYLYKFELPTFRWIALDWLTSQQNYRIFIPKGGLKENFAAE